VTPSPAFRVREIDHLVLRAGDFEGLIRFYVEVLGCPVERRLDALGLAQLRAGRSLIDIVDATGKLGALGGPAPGTAGRNLDHLCLRVDPWEPDSLVAHLEACGVSASEVASRYGAEGQGPSLYVSDPEGNTVELRGPPDA
jgi:glyoxylase I family protein